MTRNSSIVLIGAGGHACSVIDIIESRNRFQIAGLVDLPGNNAPLFGYPILGNDKDLSALSLTIAHAVISMGQIGITTARQRLFEMGRAIGFDFPVLSSASAVVSRHAHLAGGTVVGHNATVNASAVIGENCIINSHVLIEHDAIIGAHSHIATGVIVNGGTNIGPGCFIGSGAILREGLNVGAGCFIDAGSLVTQDCPPGMRIKSERKLSFTRKE